MPEESAKRRRLAADDMESLREAQLVNIKGTSGEIPLYPLGYVIFLLLFVLLFLLPSLKGIAVDI